MKYWQAGSYFEAELSDAVKLKKQQEENSCLAKCFFFFFKNFYAYSKGIVKK